MNVKKIFISLFVFLVVCIFINKSPVVTYAAEDDRLQQLNKMIELRRNGNFEDCISVANQILASDNTFMEAYYNKSYALMLMNKPQEALEVLRAQLQLDPRNELALYNAACISSLLGKNEQAFGYLKQLLTLNISMKKKIKKDSDFSSIKLTEEFQRLSGISVRVGGELLDSDVPPIITEGRTMLPMRSIFETLGAQVSWDGTTNTVTAIKNGVTVSLTIGEKIAVVNGADKEMEVPPMLRNGRTLVPVRFISEALGAKVNWDPDNELVDILSNAPIGTGGNYDTVKKELDSMIAVSVVDGMWPEPYRLPQTEGMTLIIAKDKRALDLMNSLDESSKVKYMYQTTYDNFALMVGCEVVHMKFVYNGKVYYSGEMIYDKKGEGIELTYYEKGLPINVVKQYKTSCNYKDFYLLPESEQTTSKIGD